MNTAIKFLITAATYLLFFKWLLVVINLVKRYCEIVKKRRRYKQQKTRRERKEFKGKCVPLRSPVYYKPDPMIYSQSYLMKLGFAVTWDNPDIQLYKDGIAVSSHAILPDTEYDIVARIWNASYDAPVVGMPVKFSFLDFGAGTISKNIGQTLINLGIIGGSDNPNFAKVKWKTPSIQGHYCIQVFLEWSDDKNPDNNLGQENTNVVAANSPAFFDFKVHNEDKRKHVYHFEVDTYTIPKQKDCDDPNDPKEDVAKHQRRRYPIPADWVVEFNPVEVELLPSQEIDVKVKITPPNTFIGKQPFNINVFDERNKMTGGVTVYIEKN